MDIRRQFSQVEVEVSSVIKAPIGKVWASISRFGDLGDQTNDVSTSNGPNDQRYQRLGARRVVYIGTGRLIEELTALDNEKQTLSYKLVNDASNINPFPASFLNNRCTIKLRAVTVTNETFVDIQSRFMTDHAMADAMEQTWERMYTSMLTDLNRHMCASAVPQVQQPKAPLGAGTKRDFHQMAGQTQQSLGYPGNGGVLGQAYATAALSDPPQQPLTGTVPAGPSQPPTGFVNGSTHPSSPFASVGTASATLPMGPQAAHGALPANYSMAYQGSQGTLHTMTSSSSIHTQHLHSTGSSILQALGSGGSAALLTTQQQQQQKTLQHMQQQQGQIAGHGQLGQFGQPPVRSQLGTPHKSQPSGGYHPGTNDLNAHHQAAGERGAVPMMGDYGNNCMDAALLPPTASLGIKTPSPQCSSAFEMQDLGQSGSIVVNNALMSRLMEMIHLPGQASGPAAGAGGIQETVRPDFGNQPESASLLMDCELTGPELNSIKSRLAHEVISGNSSSGSRSPAAQGRGPPVVPMRADTGARVQMSSPFGAPNLQRNASANMGVSTPDQGGEHKFLACPA
eukprot:jgi/Botrbrau1/8264/Bobra.0001s0016.7